MDADLRIADRSHDPRLEIVETVDVVDDREVRDVVRQSVDREIAAEGIFFRRSERVVVMNQMPAYGGGRVRRGHALGNDFFAGRELPAKRRDLDNLRTE